MQGRGVMIDLHAHVGRERVVIGYDRLMRVIEADKVAVEEGDMVCLHTGFGALLLELGGAPDPAVVNNACAVLDGRDQKLLRWITDSGLACLIADNYAVEAHPALPGEGCCATLPLHEHCLFRLGVNLGELWHLTPLADWLRANGRYRFLLTAPPLRLTRAVGVSGDAGGNGVGRTHGARRRGRRKGDSAMNEDERPIRELIATWMETAE